MRHYAVRLFATVALLTALSHALAQTTSPASQPVPPKLPPDLPKNCCIRLTAAMQKSPPRITLSWQNLPACQGFAVSRASKDSTSWTKLADLPPSVLSFTDDHVAVGEEYQYRVLGMVPTAPLRPDADVGSRRRGVPLPPQEQKDQRVGFILCGIEVPLVESRGKILLLIEATQAAPLAKEIDRLAEDLVGDGWTVLRHLVKADDQPPAVRQLIRQEYQADPDHLKAVFLLGHLPVPRSGDYAPDGHSERRGAQPADVYYADMDGNYTDILTTPTTQPNTLPECKNVPGDGRFDQNVIPGTTLLQLGRIDFADLPAFAPRTETDLLRQYLDKDHNFRHKAFTLQGRCLIHDHLGGGRGISAGAVAWANCTPMFGPDKIVDASMAGWFTTLTTDEYLWAGAFSGSERTHIGGIVSTEQLTQADPKAAFYLTFGSYFVDWTAKDDVMRALLATKTYSLAATWSGPYWPVDFHAMALGETLGYCLRWSQRPQNVAARLGPYVHMSLMGDPTLRLHVLAPPTYLQAAPVNATLKLTWQASADQDVLGYHVYRAAQPAGPYTRLTQTPLTACTYTAAATPGATYMVRAIHLQTSPSGTYLNASQGAFATVPSAAP